MKLRLPDGTVIEGRRLTGLKLITPQGQRVESEEAIRQMMGDLGMEGDLEFSIEVKDDGSVGVTGRVLIAKRSKRPSMPIRRCRS